MIITVPDYYPEFKCIADRCTHTCCRGWEIDIDDAAFSRFQELDDVADKIQEDEVNGTRYFHLNADESCPFLDENGLCGLIRRYGPDMLCDICRDHPRFRNYWTDRIEVGIGLVCEEAARLILSKKKPVKYIVFADDAKPFSTTEKETMPAISGHKETLSISRLEQSAVLPEDEKWLMDYRDARLREIQTDGPQARILEYLIYRYLPDALYDGLVDARMRLIERMYSEIIKKWECTDGTFESLVETVRQYSYDVEYDEEVLARMLHECEESFSPSL